MIKNTIDKMLDLTLVDVDAIRARKFHICVETVNPSDSIALAELFRALNVDFLMLQDDRYGICNRTKKDCFDLGLVVNTHTNSLSIICEDGTMFGQDHTMVAIADYVFSHTSCDPQNSLCTHALHNVLLGIVLFLSSLANKLYTASQLRSALPGYHIVKNHIDLAPNVDIDSVLKKVKERFAHDNSALISDTDGLKIDFTDRWVYMCKSDTEPVIHIYSEAKTFEKADDLANQLLQFVYNIQKDIPLFKTNMNFMRQFICIVSALMLVGTTPILAQKTKAKSQKTTKTTKTTQKATAAKILYVEPEDRNYAQNLGGHMFWDYTAKESNGLQTEYKLSKEENKKLVEKYSYSTYDEAYKNLPVLPNSAEVDTREKMTRYTVCVVGPLNEAVNNYEPEPELKAESDRFNKLRMEIAKKARKGQPFDTIHVDKKWPQYNKVLDKMKAAITSLYKMNTDIVLHTEAADFDRGSWLLEKQGGAPRFYYNIYSPLVKQVIKEWFGSKECKLVQAIEDELRARVAVENPKKTPDWFVEGRKREGEIVAEYNRKLVQRWIQKSPTSTLASYKTAIAKLIAYNKEIETIRGNDPITPEYISARYSVKGGLTQLFTYYYYLMDLSDIPLVRTPATQEGAKKFKLEDSPWKLSYPYNLRRE